MKSKINYRNSVGTISATEVNQRASKPGKMMLEGYAAVYNSRTNLGRFDELIMPGAFDAADISDARFLIDHEGMPLGRTSAGTMKLTPDKKGLRYVVFLPETERARELYEAVKRGDLNKSSFAFTIAAEDWQMENGRQTRYIQSISTVVDASVVTFPAYLDTSAEILEFSPASSEIVDN